VSYLSLQDASCIFRMKRSLSLLWGRYTEEMGATPAGSDARMAATAAAAVDHWLLQLAPRQGPGCDQGLGMKTGTKMC